jgi:SAM-dependent methyltransferase
MINRMLKRIIPAGTLEDLKFYKQLLETSRRLSGSVPRRYQLRVLSELGGIYPRECPCCGYRGLFRARGYPPRYDAQCPSCGSAERHRLFKLWLDQSSETINQNTSVLHFAPEPIIRKLIKSKGVRYTSADINPKLADLVLNIEEIEQEEKSFDLIICLHVLEHVNDEKALAELFRILRPGGLVIIMTPVIEGWAETYENATVETTSERELHFGQYDHVRYFGSDIRQRIRAAHFELDEYRAVEPHVSRYGLMRGEAVFIARRPAGPA